jgi:hypothetical protein
MAEKLYLSFDDIKTQIQFFADQCEPEQYDLIIGIARGGVVPAVMLSHAMKTPVDFVMWQTRDGATKDHEKLMQLTSSFERVLIVDDMNDSGTTINSIKQALNNPKVDFFTVTQYNQTEHPIANYGIETHGEWVVFPWEL